MKAVTWIAFSAILVSLLAIAIAIFGCSPLIQTGGSVSVVSPATQSNQTGRVSIMQNGGQTFDLGDNAAVDATSKSTDTLPASRMKYFAWVLIGVLILGGIGFFVFTHYRIGLTKA